MSSVLVVGATRGLGLELAKHYLARHATVYGTARGKPPASAPDGIVWVPGVDLTEEKSPQILVDGLSGAKLDIVIVSAGYFGKESFDAPSWSEELVMYTTSSIAPVFCTQALFKAGLVSRGSKVILVSSEAGSITLRHDSEGGGNYAHHASKAALNMAGKLLSLDLKPHGVAVGMLHPGFMRSEMTKSVGFDKYWDDGGAVMPAEAAQTMAAFVDDFDISKTGEFWAPRGARDIGTAEQTMGPKDKLPTPLQLPW